MKDIKIIRTVSDQNCPKCDFPEVVIIRNAETMEPITIECSKSDCDWSRKAQTTLRIKIVTPDFGNKEYEESLFKKER